MWPEIAAQLPGPEPTWPATFRAVIKGDLSAVGAVNELVYDDQVSRVDVLPEGTTGRGDQQVSAALHA